MRAKTVLAASLAAVFTISMIFAGTLVAEAAKPQAVVEWSNGFPSGEHSNLNIHGKKLEFNCDNSGEGVVDYGSSIFVPIMGISEIDFVSNKRSSLDHLKVIDPCAYPFGVPGNIDPALVQLPTGDQQVYWRILGKPNNGNNGDPSAARLTYPTLEDQCNFLPELSGDVGGDAIDCTDETLVGLGLVNNIGVFKKTDEGLVRFDPTSDTQGKGKSKAVNITDLFLWSGVICDPSLDTTGDGQLTRDDFPGLTEDDIAAAATAAGVFVDDDIISNEEFQAYLVTLGCVEFTDEWVFNIADIVIYGLDYDNTGTTLSQVRFYPTSTTDFIS